MRTPAPKPWHPSEEEFTAWRDDPVTQWVMSACRKAAEDNRQAWLSTSWESGRADQAALSEYRTRADAYRALEDTGYEGWLETHGQHDRAEEGEHA